jgi:lipopolysaccharide transport system permease protein
MMVTSNSEHSISNRDDHWDLIIQPKAHLFDLKLKEVWKYRDLLFLFVKRDFSAQYKQTILGPLWHVIQPVFTTLMFILLFGRIANIPTDGIHHVLFYMSGITIWNYFSTCLTGTSSTFVANASIFGKVYFPRLVIPLSTVMSNMVKFCIQFGLLLLAMIFYGIKDHHFYFGFSWLLVPLLVIMMAGLGLGLGIIISSLTTKYRDFSVLVVFAVQLLMYATPIGYPLSYLNGKGFAGWIAWNPLSPIVEAFRFAIFGKGTFNAESLLYSGGIIAIFLVIGILIFSRVEKTFMDTV